MEPVLLRDILPSDALQAFVRKFQVYRFSFEKNITPPVKYLTPRPEHSITFYVREPQKFSYTGLEKVNIYPPCVINGIYTTPIYRHGGHDFCAIKVVLQPTTLSRLKIVQVRELNNNYINAQDFFGSNISFLCEQLFEMNEIKNMVEAIENFLLNSILKKYRNLEPIDKISQILTKRDKISSLDWLANQSCLSVRQFIRKFEEHVGVSPKMFQKMVRFDMAYRLKNKKPNDDWLNIAITSGYYDYQHLAKDFKEFTHFTPPQFYKIEKNAPERFFSLSEV